ncbi:MAG: ABC transporter ATP-binding protein [Clostridiales bacterium]|nr:ABC transporter ATP-binding protein [Clostridiales bacterium]MDO4349827.1 ABC transporter ATP-binding protein [Eubacteriales bacterium]MDY4007390.1 ABC transporter ATP-binding protein [Candidatus Limiplasma sp.]
MADNALLEVKDLKTYFYTEEGVTPAVDGLSFTLKDGETLAIVGESGCGKSVTSLSVLRIFPSPPGKIVGGDILYKGESLLKKSEKEMRKIRGNEISMIFQEPLTSLNPVFTVGQQICESLIMHQGMSKKQAREKGVEMLKKVGIPSPEKVIDDYPHQLSGGMRQRVMIAMALACNPSILIADEPTTALDVTIQAQILQLLSNLKKELNTAIILITHDLGIVAQIAQNVMVMYAGQAVEYTDVHTLFKNTLHPYTLGLLKSIPVIGDEKESLFSIKGSIPSAKDYPKGCRFCPRCEHATEKCLNEAPELFEAEPGHWVRCWLCEGSKSNG